MSATAVEAKPWRAVALSDEEYELLVDRLGREPTPVELGIFGAMWSEHCGYKHSRPLLRRLPTAAPWVLQGPGENAGAVDIGDGLAVVFKVESHNHPSAVEPYEGAATGVGGIVRDIFTMGARPIALLNSLRFGPLEQPRNRYLFDRVVAGIGGYGNCLGIPTVGGEIFFDPSFSENPLVNAMCIGVVPTNELMRATASGPGNVLLLVGADTGRDGLHGATFASVDDPTGSHRGVVQVGDPFLEKLLMEACLALRGHEHVVAMQDLGAAGLTSSVVECASRGGVGAEIDVALVPRREAGMTAYEVMLSESQERMLLVVRPEGVDAVREVVEQWSLRATVVGAITDDGVVRVRDGAAVEAAIPVALLTEGCPTYEREVPAPLPGSTRAELDLDDLPDLRPGDGPGSVGGALLQLLSSPNVGSRRSVYEQYDHTILTNTVVAPGAADAAVLRIKGTKRGIAAAIDCNSRYCALDPALGARHAVAEATRNVSCVGATPLAITNCLNFGNPERPVGYGQLAWAVDGLAEACRALGLPVVSGNVSLYNETAGVAVMPTPTVGAVGVLADVTKHATMAWREGDVVLLVGARSPTLGGTEYAAAVWGKTVGRPPELDVSKELRVQKVVREAIARGGVRTAHDCADGGLAVALAKMAMASGVGAVVDGDSVRAPRSRLDAVWFGEAASRIVVAGALPEIDELREACLIAEVESAVLGRVGGAALVLGDDACVAVDLLRHAYEGALSRFSSRPEL